MLIEKLPPSSQRKLPPHINETVSSSELKDCGHHTVPQWERHVLWTLSSSLSTNGARLELDRVLRTAFTSWNWNLVNVFLLAANSTTPVPKSRIVHILNWFLLHILHTKQAGTTLRESSQADLIQKCVLKVHICWDFCTIRDKNAINWVPWGCFVAFLQQNVVFWDCMSAALVHNLHHKHSHLILNQP